MIEKGIESLIQAVKHDQEIDIERKQKGFSTFDRGCDNFNEQCADKMRQYEKTGFLCEHQCEYCDKFKWVIDRAKHYSEKTGLQLNEVLKGWEEGRNYWFLNYYQDCNQPKLEGETKVVESIEEFKKEVWEKGFRCPMCGGVSTNPQECDSGLLMKSGKRCDWKSYGLIPSGICVYFIKERQVIRIFKPVAWENENEAVDNTRTTTEKKQ